MTWSDYGDFLGSGLDPAPSAPPLTSARTGNVRSPNLPQNVIEDFGFGAPTPSAPPMHAVPDVRPLAYDAILRDRIREVGSFPRWWVKKLASPEPDYSFDSHLALQIPRMFGREYKFDAQMREELMRFSYAIAFKSDFAMTRIGATVDGPGDERAQIREAVAREFSPKEALDFLVTVGEHTVFQEKDIDKEIRSAGISSKVIDRPLRQAWVTSKLRNVDLRTAAIHHQEIKRRAWDLETRPGITPADLKAFRDEVREAARDPRFKRTLRQAMVDLDQTAVRNLESWHPSIVRDVQTALELQRFAKICPSHSDKSPAKDWYFIEVAGSTADAAEPGRKALRVRAGNEFTPERALEFANAVQDVAINRKAALNKELRQNRLIKPKHRGVFGDPPAKKAALREIWLVAGKFGMDFKTAAMFYQEIQRRAWDREGPQREPLQQGKRRESFVRGF